MLKVEKKCEASVSKVLYSKHEEEKAGPVGSWLHVGTVCRQLL